MNVLIVEMEWDLCGLPSFYLRSVSPIASSQLIILKQIKIIIIKMNLFIIERINELLDE